MSTQTRWFGWQPLAVLTWWLLGVAAVVHVDAAELHLSIGYRALSPTADIVSLDLAMDDARYVPVAFAATADQPVRLEVDVPAKWAQQIETYREERTPQRRQLVPLSADAVSLKSGEPSPPETKDSPANVPHDPQVLWLQVSSRGKSPGEYRIPLRVRVGDAEARLTIQGQRALCVVLAI